MESANAREVGHHLTKDGLYAGYPPPGLTGACVAFLATLGTMAVSVVLGSVLEALNERARQRH